VSWLTIGLTPHRLEFLPATLSLMAEHQAIILEEPPHPNFLRFLRDEVPISAFIEEIEAGFPEYSERAYAALREFYQKGKVICQVEPYLEKQVLIRLLLEEGASPEEILKFPDLAKAYEIEHEATGALLEFYAAMGGPFETLVEKIKAFAKADAKRIDYRDRLRAQEIKYLLPKLQGPVFIEAGYIHLRLVYYLAQNRHAYRLRVKNLLLSATRQQGLSRFLPSPGDGLTSYYLFGGRHRNISEDLLAARSLVYIKLIEKDELAPTEEEPFPHLRNELFWRIFVGQLSFEECRHLDRFIRLLPTSKARKVAHELYPKAAETAKKVLRVKFAVNS